MPDDRPRLLLSWSSGKDAAWALHVLRSRGEAEVVGLLATLDERDGRVPMHGAPRAMVEAQADAAGLPLFAVPLPTPCPNAVYEERVRAAVARAAAASGASAIAFGDLFLRDVRDYRERLLQGTGVEPIFPLWGTPEDTPELARRMMAGGLEAVVVCVDAAQLDPSFAGRPFDPALLADLPAWVDPCGERGEFHTFCTRCPAFRADVPAAVLGLADSGGFRRAEIGPATPRREY